MAGPFPYIRTDMTNTERSKLLNLIPVGTDVTIGKDIAAKILAICIYDNYTVDYQVVWWNARERKVDWVSAEEVTTEFKEDFTIGFRVKG